MPFSTLIGNQRIKTLLQRAVAEGRIGQSLLMAGPRGVGKYAFAIALAQALNCERVTEGDSCGECVTCRKIERKEHGDVRTILREIKDPLIKKDNKSQFIKIDQTREMAEQAQFRPYEGRRRVFILDDADWLRLEAQNSLLKTLEEPPESSVIILVTSKPYSLLDTIRSRCQMLNFAPLSADEIEQYLRTRLEKPADEARLLARLAGGSVGRALEIDQGEFRGMRNKVLEAVEALSLEPDTAKLIGASEYLGRKLDKEGFESHLDCLLILMSDLFHLKLDPATAALTNADVTDRLERVAENVTVEQIIDWADRIEEIFRGLPRNINRQLAMDTILMIA